MTEWEGYRWLQGSHSVTEWEGYRWLQGSKKPASTVGGGL